MIDSYGVLGNPIKHSLSPQIHTFFSKQFNINLQYKKILTVDFIKSANEFIKSGAKGFNITVPFKIMAFNFATNLSKEAQLTKAVNTIKIKNNKIIGYNTDGAGLINDLTINLNVDLNDKIILLLGAGGASRGIVPSLLQQNPKKLMIANRTASKAISIAQEFKHLGNICGFSLSKIKNNPVDIIINATSSSLNNEMPNIENGVANNAICYDLMYGKITPFIKWAQNNNAKQLSDGFGMLVEQAAIAFEIWHNKKPNTTEIIKNRLFTNNITS